ncbi:hypothetical protein C8Q75DRAFT_801895 [Abortiporus biennis]|nr:hypothetical protein C8Q75DRAFT_801895 [Abortiporus biennis]
MLPLLQTSITLEGVNTDVLIQTFADRILVLITQLGKVGNLIQASIPATTPLLPPPPPDPEQPNVIPLPPPSPALELAFLLGSAPSDHVRTLQSLYASQVATLVWTSEAEGSLEAERKSVIVGIALRPSGDVGEGGHLNPHEKATFYGVMEVVRDLLKRK